MRQGSIVLILTLANTMLGCGRAPDSQTANPASQTIPTSADPSETTTADESAVTDRQHTRTSEREDEGWQTIQGHREWTHFTLQLPPDWKWDGEASGDGELNVFCATDVSVDVASLLSSEKTESSESAARKKLQDPTEVASLPPLTALSDRPVSMTPRDQQMIKVRNVYAAWMAVAAQPEGQSLPIRLITYCVLLERGREFRIECNRI